MIDGAGPVGRLCRFISIHLSGLKKSKNTIPLLMPLLHLAIFGLTMNLYSNKQRWKIILLGVALSIVGITLWYSNHITEKIRSEEYQKVKLWSEAIQRRAKLVNFTKELFEDIGEEERVKVDLWKEALTIINKDDYRGELTFVTQVFFSNNTVPVFILDEDGNMTIHDNIPDSKASNQAYMDSLKLAILQKREPIQLSIGKEKQFLYYDDSYVFTELQRTMDDLINSFISETVINAASVPVLLTDSTRRQVIRFGNLDTTLINSPELLAKKLEDMASQNDPIEIELPVQGKNYIYYEDSLVILQLQYYPVVQLILIGVFLLVAYLIFSTFRRAEQNQVWVGMAKETAHQLGTPLSSLVGWISLLESQGVDKSTLSEMNKDVLRLGVITDRFSKIGSKPDLNEDNIVDVTTKTMEYLRTRMSKRVLFSIHSSRPEIRCSINEPLFSWVLENLIKNAVDAMGGNGSLDIEISEENQQVFIDLTDTGKGIPKNKQKTVFEPGYTTKKRGWGLGLSLCKRIVEDYHQGKIFVKRSEPGKGTTFRIVLGS